VGRTASCAENFYFEDAMGLALPLALGLGDCPADAS